MSKRATSSLKRRGLTVILAALTVAALTACSAESTEPPSIDSNGRVTGPDINTVNAGDPTVEGGEVIYTLRTEIVNWNVTSAQGNNGTTLAVTLPLLPSAFVIQPDFTYGLNTNVMESAEVLSSDPQVVEYVIRDEAQWSDGTPITADDFIYTWQTQNGRDCPDCLINASDGHDLVSAIEVSSDDGKVFEATFDPPFIAWQGLFPFVYPAHLADAYGSMADSYNEFFGTEVPYWSGGPYIVESYEPGQLVTMVPNEKWYGEPQSLDSLQFRIISDAAQQVTALQNSEVTVLNGAASSDLLAQIQALADTGIVYQSNLSSTWVHMGVNMNDPVLNDHTLRRALFTAIDVREIIDRTVGDFSDEEWPLKGNVMLNPNQEGYVDQFGPAGFGLGDVDAAIGILEEAGYELVDGRLQGPSGEAVGTIKLVAAKGVAYIEDAARIIMNTATELGFDVDLTTDPALSGNYLAPGNYSFYVNAFATTPRPAVKARQLWMTDAGQNYGSYSNPEVDALIDLAVNTDSNDESNEYLNQAGEIITEDAYVLPLFQSPTLLAYYDDIVNLRDNPSSIIGPAYNTFAWGLID